MGNELICGHRRHTRHIWLLTKTVRFVEGRFSLTPSIQNARIDEAEYASLPMKEISNLYCSKIYLLLSIVVLCGCVSRNSGEGVLIDRDVLMTRMSVGEIIPFKRISEFNEGYICILYPYQSAVSLEYPKANEINAYIKTVNIKVDESHWSVVFFSDTQVLVDTLRRSKQLDIMGGHELKNQSRLILPNVFEPTDCTDASQAAFYKLQINNRDYLLFGRTK